MNERRKKIVKFSLAIIANVFIIYIIAKLMPWFLFSGEEEVRREFVEYIESLGFLGIILFLCIHILQIVIAIIPGETVELLAGMAYGTWLGFLLCILGIITGTCIVFLVVRRFGQGLVEYIFSSEKIKRFSFLNNEKKLEIIIFVLFLLPGTPKDILTYIAPMTKIKLKDFLLIATFARIPSVLSSTYTGNSIVEGQWWKTILMFAIMGIIGILGIVINHSIIKQKNKK